MSLNVSGVSECLTDASSCRGSQSTTRNSSKGSLVTSHTKSHLVNSTLEDFWSPFDVVINGEE